MNSPLHQLHIPKLSTHKEGTVAVVPQRRASRRPPFSRKPACLTLTLYVALSTVLGLAPVRAVAVEPISTTAVAIWGITQGLAFLLRLGKSGADPHFVISAQNRDMIRDLLLDSKEHARLLEEVMGNDERLLASVQNGQVLVAALHHRIDVLGESMLGITGKIDDIPSIIRKDVQALLDKHREEDLGGLVDTIDNHLRDLQRGNVRKDDLQQLWTDYLMLRNTLISHQTRGLTSLMMPKLYLFEERLWRALGFSPIEIESYRRVYSTRIDRELDDSLPGTTMNQYRIVLDALRRNEAARESARVDLTVSIRMADTVVKAIAEFPDRLGVEYMKYDKLSDLGYSGGEMLKWANWFIETQYTPTITEFVDRWQMRRQQLRSLTDTYAKEKLARERHAGKMERIKERQAQLERLAALYAASITAIVEFAGYVRHDVPHSVMLELHRHERVIHR